MRLFWFLARKLADLIANRRDICQQPVRGLPELLAEEKFSWILG
jgi:hypothetical protein